MNFIADAMLGSLAKRLRLLGYDVIYDPQLGDNDILRLSLEQGRAILTRDRRLAARPLARNCLFIGHDRVDVQVRQVLDLHPLPAPAPLTRCSVCNGMLKPLDRTDARDRVPDHVYRTVTRFFACPGCERIYWEGSHVKNMAHIMHGKRKPAR